MNFMAKAGRFVVVILPWILAVSARANDWPQWRGPNRDGTWHETGIVEKFPPGGLKIRWRAPVGFGFSTPIVVQGRVYVTDSELVRPHARERLYALDEITGKPHWTYADDVDYPDWAYDAASPLGPRATPIVSDGRLYTLGIFGSVLCLDLAKGEKVWKRDLKAEYKQNLGECTGSPLLDGDRLIVTVGAKPEACVIAFDKNTGKDVWKALNDGATFSSPIIINAGGVRQLIVWTYQEIVSLDPATGKPYWREKLSGSGEFLVPTPVVHGNLLLVGGIMMQLDADKPAVTVLWPQSKSGSKRVISDTSTAVIWGDHVYSAKSTGELVCLEARTGKQVWSADKVTDLRHGSSIHITPLGNAVAAGNSENGFAALLYNDRGELIRAELLPKGYKEFERFKLLEPTSPFSGGKFAWPPPSFANRHIFVRNDKELICASLAAEP